MQNTKKCSKCKKVLSAENFTKERYWCKKCRAESAHIWYLRNKNIKKYREKRKKWYLNNKDRQARYACKWYSKNKNNKAYVEHRRQYYYKNKENRRQYYYKNKEKYNQRRKSWYHQNRDKALLYQLKWQKHHRTSSPQFVLENRMKAGIWKSLHQNKKGFRWETLVGYTAEDLRKHIESQFKNGMTWPLLMQGKIHIDHIIPASSFKYNSYNDPAFRRCWSLENLQPLWAKDNLSKGKRLNRVVGIATT